MSGRLLQFQGFGLEVLRSSKLKVSFAGPWGSANAPHHRAQNSEFNNMHAGPRKFPDPSVVALLSTKTFVKSSYSKPG